MDQIGLRRRTFVKSGLAAPAAALAGARRLERCEHDFRSLCQARRSHIYQRSRHVDDAERNADAARSHASNGRSVAQLRRHS